MAPPKRTASRLTVAALTEDLLQTRWAGGLARAGEAELQATAEWLAVGGLPPGEEPLRRARDLLLHYVKRVCDPLVEDEDAPAPARTAAASLGRLLLRPAADTELARVIRRRSAAEVGYAVSPDAVRHQEDRLLLQIAEQAASDLQIRRLDVPQTVEAAIHGLAPHVVDLRQQLHDGLCLTYPSVPAPNPYERATVEGYIDATVVELGEVCAGAMRLEEVGFRLPNLTRLEFGFVSLARMMYRSLFAEEDDRTFMVRFVRETRAVAPQEQCEKLRGVDGGEAVYQRCRAWLQSCYPTCAFERTTDTGYMCTPHAFLTLLYNFEFGYEGAGYAKVEFPENEPIRHSSLPTIFHVAGDIFQKP